MRLALVLVLSLVVVAGCTKPEEPVQTASSSPTPEAPAAAPPADPTPETMPTPSPTPASSAPATTPTPTPTPPPPQTTTRTVTRTENKSNSLPVNWSGTTGSGATLCQQDANSGGCFSTGQFQGNDSMSPEAKGAVTAFALSVSWESASPLTDELELRVTVCPRKGDCDTQTFRGASPLVANSATINATGNDVRLRVVVPAQDTGIGSLATSPDQPFEVEGTVTYVTTTIITQTVTE